MSLLLNITRLLLLSLSGLAFYLTWYIFMNNGAAQKMQDIRDNGPDILPYTDGGPLRKTYTGIAMVDYQLTILVLFFYNIVDGSHPNACLQAYHFFGQAIAGYSLLVLEGLRYGNKWKIISFIALWGLAFQLATFAVIIPIYFTIHLSTSPTAGSWKRSQFSVDPLELTSIPYSVALGLILPSIATALPAPSVIGYERKQMFMAIWQAFPLWVGLFQQIIPFLTRQFTGNVGVGKERTHNIKELRKFYLLLLTAAVVTQASTWTMSISAVLFPNLFAPDAVSLLTPTAVFKPKAASPLVKMPSTAAGSLQLLQYDEIVGVAALMLWSAALYVNASGNRRFGGWVSLIAKGVAVGAIAGPQGLAVAAVWARDEIVFADDNSNKKDL
ncbi:MAG: hypothetical protein Q9179_002853 [Wetmoreana sp. 5 TL-2023]